MGGDLGFVQGAAMKHSTRRTKPFLWNTESILKWTGNMAT
jgi:hypothetical protein